MEQSSTIPMADDTKPVADVSRALERMGRILEARSVMFVERVNGSEMFTPIEVWDRMLGSDAGTIPETPPIDLGSVTPMFAGGDHPGVIPICGPEAEAMTGCPGGTAFIGFVTGADDLAVILCYDDTPASDEMAIAAVTQFCDLAGQITMRARAQALLDDRLKLERSLSRASLGLAEVDAASCEAEIGRHLGRIGQLIGSIVATIWDDGDDGKVHRTHLWVNPDKGNPDDYPIDTIPVGHPVSMAIRSLATDGVVKFSDHFSRREPRHGDSLVAAPLLVDGEVTGAVTFAFNDMEPAHHDIGFWNSAAAGFAALVTHTRRRARAEKAENRAQRVDAAVGGIARLFVEARSSSFDDTMDKAMEALGGLIGACCTSYHEVDPATGGLELRSIWSSGTGCSVRGAVGQKCVGEIGECGACGRMAMPVGSGDRVTGQIVCDLGFERNNDPLVLGILSAVASLVSQFCRRCDAEVKLEERRAVDKMLHEVAAMLIESTPVAQDALTKLLDSLGATHVSMWREHSGWRSSGRTRAECMARASGLGGRSSLSIPLSLVDQLEHPGEVLNREIRHVPRWLEAVVGERLKPAARCISLATSRIDADEMVLLFVLSDGVAPVNEARREMMLRAVAMLGQHHARVAAEETFSLAFESAPSAISIRGHEGRLISCNNAYVEFTGRPREELLGGRLDDLLAEAGTVGDISDDESFTDLPYRRPSGEVVWGRARFNLNPPFGEGLIGYASTEKAS